MTGADPTAGAGPWVVLCVVLVAVLAARRRRLRERRAALVDVGDPSRFLAERSDTVRPIPRRAAALLVVVALMGGSALVGTPAMAQPLDCKEAPEPDRPGTGLVGSLDALRPDAGEPGSVYREVGYAGMVWHNYDLGCAGSAVLNPATTTDTWLGNQTFNIAKLTVAGVNWAHYLIASGGALLSPLDSIISTATKAMYDAVFTTFIGVALLILAVILIVLAMRGDLARQTQRAAFAALALLIGSAAYLTPVDWSKAADNLLLDGVTQMQEGFLSQVGLGTRDTLPTVLVDQVIYRNWERGEFGSPDVPQAQQFGRDLLRAQTFTIDEVLDGQDNAQLAQQKKTDFTNIAGQLGDRYPYFQGKAGSRIGAGLLAVVQAICIALFQLLSKVLVLVAMLLLRLMVMCAPAIAVVAVLKPEVLPALLRVAGAAIVNTLVVGALAGLHALLVVSLFRPDSGIDLWLALLVTGVVTVVMWAVARPFRRLVSMVSLTRDQFGGIVPGVGGGPMSGVWRRFRGAPADDRQSRWWTERQAGGAADDPDAGRPETVTATATVVGGGSAARQSRRRNEVQAPGTAALGAGSGPRALAAGPGGGTARAAGVPGRSDPGEVDERVIYRRPDAAPTRTRPRAVDPELVDGVPVYRIYRPRAGARPAYGRSEDG
ncbi:hypothetical protein ACFQ34_33295 [Pseudonocardia benzenivorans]|uniref:TrbL/VirB6 plasmid conjugal transfer protein n=1 Tax=Pseudonocardia benzenivorans TaxID=228005 RepID=A0ABW3VTR6_9PSEU